MAYQTGTATDHADLYAKIIAFLTADPELVADAENWEIVFDLDQADSNSLFNTLDSNSLSEIQYAPGIVLKGPGLSGDDEIYVGMTLTLIDVPGDTAALLVRGMANVNPDAASVWDHINVMPNSAALFLRTGGAMDYWITANGRRFIVGVRVSTVYGALYAGLFLPYVLPEEYPYPLFVGGMGNASTETWKTTNNDHAIFMRGQSATAHDGAYTLDPTGTWLESIGYGTLATQEVAIGPWAFGHDQSANDFYVSANSGGSSWNGYAELQSIVDKAYGDEWVLTPCTLHRLSGGDQALGALDGFYHIGGNSQTAENVVTVEGIDHIVLQDAFRTTNRSYFAFVLGVPGSNS